MRPPTACEAPSEVIFGMKLVMSAIVAWTKVSPKAGFSPALAVS
jgi:hypothetical protein